MNVIDVSLNSVPAIAIMFMLPQAFHGMLSKCSAAVSSSGHCKVCVTFPSRDSSLLELTITTDAISHYADTNMGLIPRFQ